MKNKLTFIVLLSLCLTIVGADSIGKFKDCSQTNEILRGVQGYLIQSGDAKGSILGGRPKSGTCQPVVQTKYKQEFLEPGAANDL
jgi:hypothetical protein